ncbi:response regulator [Bacillus sp. SD075]|nr:response regulator [Bacillus sp. SD075]
MDMNIPIMSGGQDAAKKLRRVFQAAKVILFFALDQQKVVVEAIENGAQDCIFNPFDEGRVLYNIKMVLINNTLLVYLK